MIIIFSVQEKGECSYQILFDKICGQFLLQNMLNFEIISSFLQESINKLFLCDTLVFFKIY